MNRAATSTRIFMIHCQRSEYEYSSPPGSLDHDFEVTVYLQLWIGTRIFMIHCQRSEYEYSSPPGSLDHDFEVTVYLQLWIGLQRVPGYSWFIVNDPSTNTRHPLDR